MEKVIKLEFPIKNGEITIDEIKLVRLKAKHLKKMPKDQSDISDTDSLLFLVSCMNGIPVDVLGELDLKDMKTISQEVASFL